MFSGSKLSKTGSDLLSNPSVYRSVIGALQYLTIIHPEFSFVVNKVWKIMARPLESH
uniref:Retrovirus-related Pol polyprotein from transposon TNT 1-94 n=1 Tax=Cajanus cajan TaxID=3821 RepID=A0A151U2Y2_CAJCA|nr:hypothetical protein KK1_006276 [Cajanus cajan]